MPSGAAHTRARVSGRARYACLRALLATALLLSGLHGFPVRAQAALTLDTSGCTGGSIALGMVDVATPKVSGSDCRIGFGNDGGPVQLRAYQTDGSGAAMPGVNDYAAASSDWSTGSNMFGACLRALTAGATTSWSLPGDASCDAVDGDPWNAVPIDGSGASSLVAEFATGSYTADLRFGLRTAAAQPAGSYAAGITIEVLQPAGAAPTNLTSPTITGTATSGQTLTASTGTWANSPTSYAYQWRRCDATGAACVDIVGATSSTHVLGDADVDATIRVVVTASNGSGSGTATSDPTARIAGIAPTAGTATISGTVTAGQTLTAAESGTWTTGSPATSPTYQWRRCDAAGGACVDIAGATSSTYGLGAADVDSTIRVVITRTNSCASGCGTASATSGATTQVAGVAPTAGAVTISGTAQNTRTLTSSLDAAWTTGTPAGTTTYQWRRCNSSGSSCIDIPGATSSTYVLTSNDIDYTIRVVATRTNTCAVGCGSTSATSAQTATIAGILMVGSSGDTATSSSSLTAAVPAGTASGDLMVAAVVARDGSDQVITPPSGWTLLRRTNEDRNLALATYWKLATASEPAGYTFSWTVTRGATLTLMSFSAVDQSSPIDVSSGAFATSGTSHTAASVTTTAPHTLLLGAYGVRVANTSYTPPSGMTEISDLTNGEVTGMVARQPWAATGATGTRAATGPSGSWAAQLIAIRSAP